MTAGTSATKSKRKTAYTPLTADDAVELQKEIDATQGEIEKITHWVKNRLGNRAVAPNAARDAAENGKLLEDHYKVLTDHHFFYIPGEHSELVVFQLTAVY